MNSFSELTSEGKYWIGYLLADGSVSGNRLSLTSIDLEVVEKFKSFVGFDKDIKEIDPKEKCIRGKNFVSGTIYTYGFSDKDMVSILSSYGLVENKTHIALAPELLKADRDFWLGYAEGNGHYNIDSSGRSVFEITSGSEVLCQQFLDYCKSLIPISKVNVTKEGSKNAFRVRFCGKYGAYILRHLYQNAQPIMTRKYNKAAEIIKLYAEELAVLDSIPICKQCSGKRTVKDGKSKGGGQRYQCRDCKIKFVPIELQVKSGRKPLSLNLPIKELVFA